jgi:putative flippase GtrA
VFRDRADSTLIQFFRYGLVGGVAFLVDFSSLVFLTSVIMIHYLWSAAIAFLLGLATNYLMSVTWVFSRRALSNKYLEFGIFAWIGIIGLGLNEVFMWFFTEKWLCHYTVSKVLSTVLVFLWNFVSRKLILFGDR